MRLDILQSSSDPCVVGKLIECEKLVFIHVSYDRAWWSQPALESMRDSIDFIVVHKYGPDYILNYVRTKGTYRRYTQNIRNTSHSAMLYTCIRDNLYCEYRVYSLSEPVKNEVFDYQLIDDRQCRVFGDPDQFVANKIKQAKNRNIPVEYFDLSTSENREYVLGARKCAFDMIKYNYLRKFYMSSLFYLIPDIRIYFNVTPTIYTDIKIDSFDKK
jgi:hypothetical protein